MRPDDVMAAVVEVTGVNETSIRSQNRNREVADARAVLTYALRKHSHMSFWEVRDFMRRPSHSTFVTQAKRVENMLVEAARFASPSGTETRAERVARWVNETNGWVTGRLRASCGPSAARRSSTS